MLDILNSCLTLVLGLASLVWGLISLVCVWVAEVLYYLHVSAPRLEGLLVGIALAWVLLRRDRHPVLRVLSAPLKLVIDILDLAWDHCVEAFSDCRDSAVSVYSISVGWVVALATTVYNWFASKIASMKQWLAKKK